MEIIDYKAQYKEDLKDPRWRVLSKEVLSRDSGVCQLCKRRKNRKVVMNVHHIRYYPNRKPWEYEKDDLIALCHDCHKKVHRILLVDRLYRERYFYNELHKGVGIVDKISGEGVDYEVCWTEDEHEKVNGHGRLWIVGFAPLDKVRLATYSEIKEFWSKVNAHYTLEEFKIYFGKYFGTLIYKCDSSCIYCNDSKSPIVQW